MKINSQKYHDLPWRAKEICENGGLLTGGIVAYLLDEVDDYKDIDIIVPVRFWNDISLPTNDNIEINYYNGLRFKEDAISYDVWPGDVFEYLQTASKKGSKIRVYDVNRSKLIEVLPVTPPKEIYDEDEIPF